jgi:hypothetical protein
MIVSGEAARRERSLGSSFAWKEEGFFAALRMTALGDADCVEKSSD